MESLRPGRLVEARVSVAYQSYTSRSALIRDRRSSEAFAMYMHEAFTAAIWVGVASLALVAAMIPVFWYLQLIEF
jgi:hypothetical protein